MSKGRERRRAKDPKPVWDWFDTAEFCIYCGRRGSRDFVPAHEDEVYGHVPMKCKWTVACGKRSEKKWAEKEKERAAQKAAEEAAAREKLGISEASSDPELTTPEPINLDDYFLF